MFHNFTLYRIHFIPSRCMESTAFNRDAFYHAAWITLHSMTMHEIHCIPSGSIAPQCMESSAFNEAAWNPLHSIGMLWARLHKIHCIQSSHNETFWESGAVPKQIPK